MGAESLVARRSDIGVPCGDFADATVEWRSIDVPPAHCKHNCSRAIVADDGQDWKVLYCNNALAAYLNSRILRLHVAILHESRPSESRSLSAKNGHSEIKSHWRYQDHSRCGFGYVRRAPRADHPAAYWR